MDDKSQIGLVVTHAQGGGGDQGFDPIVKQSLF
jgi:hypothetical protein